MAARAAKRAERLQVMLTIDEVRRVEEWRFENRMPSRSAAVRALMNLGLRADAAVNEDALLEGAVSSRDVGVVENDSMVAPAGERPAVLVVASDALTGQGLGRLLERGGFRVLGPARPGEASGMMAGLHPAAAVLDAGAAGAGSLPGQGIPLVIVGEAGGAAPGDGRATAVVSREGAAERLVPTLAGLIG